MAQVLVVDDETDFCVAISLLLERRGHEVSRYTRPGDLLSEAVWKSAEVIVADVTMPDLDGIELGIRLRSLGFRGKLVFITGLSKAMIAPWLPALEPCEMLRKPFRIDELCRLLMVRT